MPVITTYKPDEDDVLSLITWINQYANQPKGVSEQDIAKARRMIVEEFTKDFARLQNKAFQEGMTYANQLPKR